jgi:hypothetical protein
MPTTMLPVTLPDGQRTQLVIPQKGDSRSVYLRDQDDIHPVVLQGRNVIWDKFIRSNPTVIPKPAKSADEPSVTALKEAPVTTVKPTGEEIEVAEVVGRARLC